MKTTEEKANLFVKKLLTEGATAPCDDSVDSFIDNGNLPEFYDEELFKQGQAFFQKYRFSMMLGKLLGLMTVLSIPSVLKILMHTKMSSNSFTAYKRYMATIFHVLIWYESDFTKNSKLWKSIKEIKNLHNSASKKGYKAGIHRISQKDMALTQFGFMGVILTKGSLIGIHNATENEWKSLIHLWRVLGYLLGIDDKYNLCRGSVEETKLICNTLISDLCLPSVEKRDTNFIQMSKSMIAGLRCFQPVLNLQVLLCLLMGLFRYADSNQNFSTFTIKTTEYRNLHFGQKFILFLNFMIFYILKFSVCRWYFNNSILRDIWLMKNFPFLAYAKYGYKKSHVKILKEYS